MAVARKKAFLQRIRVRFYTFQAAIAKSSMADQTAAVSLPSKRDRSRKFQGSKCKWLWKCWPSWIFIQFWFILICDFSFHRCRPTPSTLVVTLWDAEMKGARWKRYARIVIAIATWSRAKSVIRNAHCFRWSTSTSCGWWLVVVRENYLRATNAIIHFPYLVPDIAAKSCCQCQITFVITSSPLLPHTTQLVTSRQLHCRAYQNYGYYGAVCLAQKKNVVALWPPQQQGL